MLAALLLATAGGLHIAERPADRHDIERLTELEARIMRDILAGTRGKDVDDLDKRAHDIALVRLVQRGLVHYNAERKAHKFNLTIAGRAALDAHDERSGQEPIHG
jgi:hypothetical protein